MTAADITEFRRAVRQAGWTIRRRYPAAAQFDRGDAETLLMEDPPVEALAQALGPLAGLLEDCDLVTERDGWGGWSNSIVMAASGAQR